MKYKLYFLFITIFLFSELRAQIPAYKYPSGKLTKELIAEMVEQSRKSGTQEWELRLLEKYLSQRMKDQSKRPASPPVVTSSPGCNNVDFEQGTYTGWTLTSGNISGVNLPCNTCATASGGVAAITTLYNSGATWSNGVDNCSGMPVVAPGGGNYSLCLNDNTAGGKLEVIRQNFAVTSTNYLFTFQYAVVLEDGGHPANEQPYFSYQISDGSGNVIPCAYYEASLSSGTWLPTSCASVSYLDWTSVTINLLSYIGQNVTVQYVASDCNQGGHYGYAYIDGSCGTMQIQNPSNTLCANNQALTLYAPAGLSSYSWSGPGIVGPSNTYSVSVNAAGVYSVTISGACASNYSTTLTDTVYTSSSSSPTVTIASIDTACSGNNILLTASGASSYTWSANAGSATTNTVSVSSPATVNFSVIGADMNGCRDTATKNIVILPSPTLAISVTPNDTVCHAANVTLTGSGATNYTWTNGVTNGVSFSPTVTATFVVTGASANGCSTQDSITIVVNNCTTGINYRGGETVNIFPNPATNRVVVHCDEASQISVFNSIGQNIYQATSKEADTVLDISSFSPGVYFIRVHNRVFRVVKQ